MAVGDAMFTRPVLALLMGHQKMSYYNDILESPLVQTFFSQRYLKGYFPERMQKEFEPFLEEHRLKAEIISTIIINKIINRAGITLFPTMTAATGKTVWEVSKAYLILENLLHADRFRGNVYALDNLVPSNLQYKYLMEMESVIAYALHWFITHQTEERISFDFVLHYAKIIENFQENLWECLNETCRSERIAELKKRIRESVSMNVPEELAKTYVTLPYMKDIMDIIGIKEDHHYNFQETARLYIKVRDYFQIDLIGEILSQLKASDKWGSENIANLKHELRDHQNGIVVSVLSFKRKSEDLLEAFDHYIQEKADEADEYRRNLEDIKAEDKAGIISLNVMIKRLSKFVFHGDGELL